MRTPRFASAVAVLAVAGAGVGITLTRTGGGSEATATTTVAKPAARTVLLTLGGLKDLAGTMGRPVYWVGPQIGADYELTTAPDGRIFLRYVPAGVKPPAGGAYMSVGTYPFLHAFAATTRAARKNGFARLRTGPGVVAVYAKGRPTNLYLAFRGVDYQVELFHPQPVRARGLVAQGRIVPVS